MSIRVEGNRDRRNVLQGRVSLDKQQAVQEEKAVDDGFAKDHEVLLGDNEKKSTKVTYQGHNLQGTRELTRYLQQKFAVCKGGMADISAKYLQACISDEEKRKNLFEKLEAADEMLASHEGEVGFQGMKVAIDEKGEVTVTSSKSTVNVNEGKRQRQIAAAATKGDMQGVIASLEQDLREVEEGLKQNKCDAAEVEKVKRLLEQAKQKMAQLPDRKPTAAEQAAMAVNKLM